MIGKMHVINPIFKNEKSIIYNDKTYIIDFDLLIKNSRFFRNQRKLFKNKQEISFPREEIEISSEAFESFVLCCQNKSFQLEDSIVFQLFFLSYRYEVTSLTEYINNYILENNKSLAIQSILFKNKIQNMQSTNFDNVSMISIDIMHEINTISSNFIELIETNDDLLSLPIPTLNLIVTKYLQKNENQIPISKQEIIIEFLFKCLNKYGKEASVLFLDICFEIKANIDDILAKLKSDYKDAFDFNYLNSKFLYELYIDMKKSLTAEIESKNEQIEKLGFLIKKIESEKKSVEDQVKAQESQIESLKGQVNSMNSQIMMNSEIIEKMRKEKIYEFLEISEKTDGILAFLSKKHKDEFDPSFVASTSTNDIYDLISNSNKNFAGFTTYHCNKSHSFFEIRFQNPQKVNLIKVHGPPFLVPKSFAYQINGGTPEIVHENELTSSFNNKNIEKRVFEIKLANEIHLKTLKIWPQNPQAKSTTWVKFKRVELFSSQSPNINILETIIENSKYKDYRRCGVLLSDAVYTNHFFDQNDHSFHIITDNEENSWFKVELTKGFAILTGFRLRKIEHHFLINYEIVGSYDDRNWITLFANENDRKELTFDAFKINEKIPIRYVKIIIRGKCLNEHNKENDFMLEFYHFDVFGYYFPFV